MSSAYLTEMDGDLAEQLDSALDFINWTDFVGPESTVFVKPNLTWPVPHPGVTTSAELLDALLSILSGRCGRVILGESDGGTFRAEEAFANHGLDDLCMRRGVELVNLSRLPSVVLNDTVAGRRVQIEVSAFLLEKVDFFVTVPVLKTHVVTRVSLGLKNQWGCIPTPMRLLYHHILDWGIVALNKAIGPRICILDGTYALDRRGPLEGDPVPVGWLVVSDNVVVLDTIGSHLLDVAPRSVRHVYFAEREGLGTADLQQVRLNRELPPPAIHSVIQPNLMDLIAIFLYRSRTLSKLVFDSPLTPVLYQVIRRTPPGVFGNDTVYAHSSGY
ncbi:MAG: DUF362 domain-containing protein [Anaerolineae bacterium]